MEFDAVVNKRQSIRSFKKKQVSWRLVLEAIDSSLQGPFSGNHNNLKFLIIEDENTIKKLANHSHQDWIAESPLVIVVFSNDINLENIYGERGRIYSRQQAGAAINTLILKLTDLNIDSCWVGAYTDEVIKQILKIPQDMQIEALIPTGYRKTSDKKPDKKSLDAVIYWEEWDKRRRPAFFTERKSEHRDVMFE